MAYNPGCPAVALNLVNRLGNIFEKLGFYWGFRAIGSASEAMLAGLRVIDMIAESIVRHAEAERGVGALRRCTSRNDLLSPSASAQPSAALHLLGLRKLLELAGVVRQRGGVIGLNVSPGFLPSPTGLPDDVAMLKAIVRRLLAAQRMLRSKVVVLQGEVQYATERARHYRRDAANLRRQIRQMPNRRRS